jgi:cytochrome c nitrite reductase small subunit
MPTRAKASRFSAFAAVALIAILIGAAVSTFDYAEGTSYLSDDPRACINCHIMRDQYNDWARGPHHARATCNDCHVPHTSALAKYLVKAEHGYRHSKGFTFQDFHEPIRLQADGVRIVEANCVRCHEELAGGIVHASALARNGGQSGALGCLHCHAGMGHGPTR